MKRPLVWMTVSFLLGMFLCYCTNDIISHEQVGKEKVLISKTMVEVFLLALLLLWLMGIIMYKKKSKSYETNIIPTLYYYIISFSLPVLCLVGYCRLEDTYHKPDIEGIFSDKLEVTAEGRIDFIEMRDDYQVVYITDTIVMLKDSTVMIGDSNGTYKGLNIRATVLDGTYRIGQKLKVSGTLSKFTSASNLGQFDEKRYYQMKGVDYKLKIHVIENISNDYNPYKDFLSKYKEKIKEFYLSVLPESEGSIMSAMILGESNLLEDDIKLLYNQNGISHILAISGLHISLIGSTIYQMLHRMKCNKLLITCLSIGIMISYGTMTNFSVSTNRAIVMFICMILGKLIGRTYDILSATSLSCLIILIQSPLQILNAGFLLSFGAILAIAIIVPVLQKIYPMEYNPELKKKYSIRSMHVSVINSIMVSGGVYIMILPITLYYFYEVPLYSILINILILPLSSILLILGLLSGMIGCFSALLGSILIGGSYYILKLYEFICELGTRLPHTMILVGKPKMEIILIYYFTLGLFLWNQWKKIDNKRNLMDEQGEYATPKFRKSILLLPCLLIIFYQPKEMLEVTFLDVGQGDCIYINYENRLRVMVDGGSSNISQVGKYRIIPFLKANGVTTLDYVIITHYDMDHISGIVEILEHIEKNIEPTKLPLGYKGTIGIGTLILPKYEIADGNKNEELSEILRIAKKAKINVVTIELGDRIALDEFVISCIYPSTSDSITSSNNASTVLSVTYKNFDLLLTGDIEASGEDMLKSRLESGYDILKVAHHGSKHSTKKEFLNQVLPKVSIISCGKNNSYGHPHEESIERLQNINSKIYITAEVGAITVSTDGKYYKIDEFVRGRRIR